MPPASNARAFTKLAWPLAWVRETGLSGETAERASWKGTPSTLGSGVSVHFS